METANIVARASCARAWSLSPVAYTVAIGVERHAQVLQHGAEAKREGNDHGDIIFIKDVQQLHGQKWGLNTIILSKQPGKH
jgi:hypothetical protein